MTSRTARISRAALCTLAALSFHFLAGCATAEETAPPSGAVRHADTQWAFQSSSGYDALCLLNFLGGDPFYGRFISRHTVHFQRQLPEDALAIGRYPHTHGETRYQWRHSHTCRTA